MALCSCKSITKNKFWRKLKLKLKFFEIISFISPFKFQGACFLWNQKIPVDTHIEDSPQICWTLHYFLKSKQVKCTLISPHIQKHPRSVNILNNLSERSFVE